MQVFLYACLDKFEWAQSTRATGHRRVRPAVMWARDVTASHRSPWHVANVACHFINSYKNYNWLVNENVMSIYRSRDNIYTVSIVHTGLIIIKNIFLIGFFIWWIYLNNSIFIVHVCSFLISINSFKLYLKRYVK